MRQTAEPVVSTIKPSKKISTKFHIHRPAKFNFIFVAIVLLVIIFGAAYLYWRDRPAITINGQVISKSTYNGLVAAAEKHKVSVSAAKKEIITVEESEYVAKQLNISVTQQQILTAARSQFFLPPKANDNLDSWEQLVGWASAFSSQVYLSQSGGYQGAVFFFPFDELQLTSIMGYPKPPGWGNPADIAASQKYALSEANSYYGKLKARSMTPDQVISQLQSNPKLQFAGATNSSTDFDVNTSGYTPVNGQTSSTPLDPSIIALIKGINNTGLTPIESESNSFQGYLNYTGQTATLMTDYYFVDIEQVIKQQPNLQATLKQDVNKLVVKVYV